MADERFQDFPQKTNPSGSDELVGVDGSGYFRTPVSSLPAGGDSLPEFFKFMVGDKILIVQTGQSNPQGLEGRRAAAGGISVVTPATKHMHWLMRFSFLLGWMFM